MRRDWDLIRIVLLEVEAVDANDRNTLSYGKGEDHGSKDEAKADQALMLWNAGYIKGIDGGTMAGPAVLAPELTWSGHDLLDILRSEKVWERIKTLAESKGIELSFDAVKVLHQRVLTEMLAD